MAENETPNQRKLIEAAYKKIRSLQKKLDEKQEGSKEEIAIIGVACRLPGGITSPKDFWEALIQRKDLSSEMDADRFDLENFYDESRKKEGSFYVKRGGFLDDIKSFDASFFGISPREAKAMDPQQRMLMELSWEAFENAGLLAANFRESQTGVFVGISEHEYTDNYK